MSLIAMLSWTYVMVVIGLGTQKLAHARELLELDDSPTQDNCSCSDVVCGAGGSRAEGVQEQVGTDGSTTTTKISYSTADHSNVTLLLNVRSVSDINNSPDSGPVFDFYLNQTMEIAGMGGGGGGGSGGGGNATSSGGGGGGGGGIGINGVLNVTYVLNLDSNTVIFNSTNAGPKFNFHINTLPPNYDNPGAYNQSGQGAPQGGQQGGQGGAPPGTPGVPYART